MPKDDPETAGLKKELNDLIAKVKVNKAHFQPSSISGRRLNTVSVSG